MPACRSSATTSSRRSARRSRTASSRRLFQRARRPPRPDDAAQRRRQLRLPQHARARPPRVEEDLEDERRHLDARLRPRRGERPRRPVRLRAVADRPQVGVHPHGGLVVRRRAAQPGAQARGLGLAELGRHRDRRRPAREARPEQRDLGRARGALELPDEVAAGADRRQRGAREHRALHHEERATRPRRRPRPQSRPSGDRRVPGLLRRPGTRRSVYAGPRGRRRAASRDEPRRTRSSPPSSPPLRGLRPPVAGRPRTPCASSPRRTTSTGTRRGSRSATASAIGLVNLGLRGPDAWIGGLGVVPTARRQGIGRAADGAPCTTRPARAASSGSGSRCIVENTQALALYEQLGYEHVRDVEVWSLDGRRGRGPRSALQTKRTPGSVPTGPSASRGSARCLAREGQDGTRGLLVDGAAAVVAVAAGRVSVLQLAGGRRAAP